MELQRHLIPAVSAEPGRIRVIGPNPAMDRLQVLPRLAAHGVNRSLKTTALPGGKSLIVARTVRRLEEVPVLYGFLGGAVGEFVRQECSALGMEDRHTGIAGETRITSVLVEEGTGRSTVVNEQGPVVTPAELERLLESLVGDCAPGDMVALTGSLPRGVPKDFYAQVVRALAPSGSRVVVDASGEALEHAAAAAPWALKCNLEEFSACFAPGPGFANEAALLQAMDEQLQAGTRLVVVTLGADGLLAAGADGVWQVLPPQVSTVNPTGSGDTFLGAFLVACARGADIPDALRLGTAAAAANAASFEPDLGENPDLAGLLAAVRVQQVDTAAACKVVS